MGKKQLFHYTVVLKKPACTPCVGGWRLAFGDRRLVAVGGGERRLVVGDWWLMAVGNGWRLAAVGGWRRLVVGGPLGWSQRAVLNRNKILVP